jgi:TonB family protein
MLMAALAGDPQSLPAPGPSVITMPDWLNKPSAEDLARFYPKAASKKGLDGRATIRCSVNAEGLLVDCAAISEDPAGEGFGDAAVAMASKFKMRPMTKDGVPVTGGIVRIPMRFVLPKPEPIPTLAVAMRCYGFAAAQAEATPTSPEVQLRFYGWRFLVEVKSVPQKNRPSELEAQLLSLRQEGARDMAGGGARAEREFCDGLIKGGASDLEKIVSDMGG